MPIYSMTIAHSEEMAMLHAHNMRRRYKNILILLIHVISSDSALRRITKLSENVSDGLFNDRLPLNTLNSLLWHLLLLHGLLHSFMLHHWLLNQLSLLWLLH